MYYKILHKRGVFIFLFKVKMPTQCTNLRHFFFGNFSLCHQRKIARRNIRIY